MAPGAVVCPCLFQRMVWFSMSRDSHDETFSKTQPCHSRSLRFCVSQNWVAITAVPGATCLGCFAQGIRRQSISRKQQIYGPQFTVYCKNKTKQNKADGFAGPHACFQWGQKQRGAQTWRHKGPISTIFCFQHKLVKSWSKQKRGMTFSDCSSAWGRWTFFLLL